MLVVQDTRVMSSVQAVPMSLGGDQNHQRDTVDGLHTLALQPHLALEMALWGRAKTHTQNVCIYTCFNQAIHAYVYI